ncbi:MAG: hypothetical protein QM743_02655 [Chitinophagaceae bacterium]
MKKGKHLTTALLAACLSTSALAQSPDNYGSGLKLDLNQDGTKFVRFIMWHQFWTTYTQNNPGTKDVNGDPQSSTMDIGIRRSRFLAYSQISPRFLILTHWGINNVSFINGGGAGTLGTGASATGQGGKRPQLYIHDAWSEYAVVKGKLHIGTGLHYWNGVSRLSSASTLNFMTMDAPIFNWYNIEATDQFARQFGIYAKGQVGRLDYRVSVNKPYVYGVSPTKANIRPDGIAVNAFTEKAAFSGYFDWAFKDKENNTLPYFVGTYLGKKEVLNIGAGFYTQANATASARVSGADTLIDKHTQTCIGVDFFWDKPLNKAKGTALSIYSVYYNYNFGPNYLRNIGILNLHANTVAPTESFAGAGNLQPTIGTGSIWYTQVGYKFPNMKNGSSFMPYVTTTYKDFNRLAASSFQYDLGLNYFVSGHNAKITLQYTNRPIYKLNSSNGAIDRDGSKGEFVIQTHIFL